jgi:hypothetical protein
MSQVPVCPLSPDALPQQRIYLVQELPRAPAGWTVSFDCGEPGLPKHKPSSARLLGQVEWAWSPMHSRIDAYHVSLNSARNRWVLWISHFDDEVWRFVDARIAASAPRARLTPKDAAILLLEAFWRSEVADDHSFDAPHWINQDALLSTGELREIERRVWGLEVGEEGER